MQLCDSSRITGAFPEPERLQLRVMIFALPSIYSICVRAQVIRRDARFKRGSGWVEFPATDIVILSYETLGQMVGDWPFKIQWGSVIVDEAHRLKGLKSQARGLVNALQAINKVLHRIAAPFIGCV